MVDDTDFSPTDSAPLGDGGRFELNIVQRLLLIVFLAAIPLGVLQALNLRNQHRQELEDLSGSALRTAQRAGAEQDRIADGAQQLLTALSQLAAVQSGSPSQCGSTLKRLQAQFPIYIAIGVSTPQGKIWCSSSRPGTDISDRAYFRKAIQTRKFTTGGYIIGRLGGHRSLNFSLPFENSRGELAGVLVTGLDLDLLARDLGRVALPADTKLTIAGPDRRVLVDLPSSSNVGRLLPPAFQKIFEADKAGAVELRWFDGSDRLVGFVPPGIQPGGPFLVAVGIDRNRALAIVTSRAIEDATTLAVTVSTALLLAWWFATRFVRSPIRRLASTVRAWREGDASARVGRLDSGSEFQDLGQAFDSMADAVEERQRRLRAALESTTDSVVALGPDWVVTYLNGRAIVRLQGTELLGRNILEVFPTQTGAGTNIALQTAMTERRPVSVEFDYEPLKARFEVNAFPARDGGLTLFIRDVSEQHRAREELRYLALHDSLTGLPNRTSAMEIAQAKLAAGQLSAMILVDLDGFKHVNDGFGHLAGDEMLRQVARRLERALPDNVVVARLGGDEFLAIVFAASRDDCLNVCNQIIDHLGHNPFVIGDRQHFVTSSCGLVRIDEGSGQDIEELLANADLALYRAKEAGGGTCHAYVAADRDDYQAHRLLVEEVARAAAGGEFELQYQPQVRLEDGAWVGAEALLRWRHPTRGLLQPAAFLDILEHSRHAAAVGSWAIDQACREAAKWWKAGKRLRIGVNLFAEQIRSGNLLDVVQHTLARHGLPPEALELELTETIALAHEEGASKLAALRDLGVRLAFDDFGTGFASLTTLKSIPVHRLKIDRGFVTELPADEHDAAIVEAVVALARTLHLEVIAEGVETAEQAKYLLSRGCQEAQGFLYAKAMPAREFRASIP